MSESTCEAVRAALPEWARGESARAADLEAHLARCADCAREAALLRTLYQSQPAPPPELEGRIRHAVQGAVPTSGAPGTPPAQGGTTWLRRHPWPLAAAAVLVLVVGTALLERRTGDPSRMGGEGAGDPDPWLMDDWGGEQGIVAGVPVIEQLSDEQLLTLLEELGG